MSVNENYGVEPETGRIYSFISNKFLKSYKINSGYLCVDLQRKTYLVHRLVASILPTYDKKLQVNHKDGDRTNNKLSNLEWVTPKENLDDAVVRNPHLVQQKKDAAKRAQIVNRKKIVMINKEGIETVFDSLLECAEYIGTRPPNVSRWLNGVRNCSAGYTFKEYDIV